MSYAGQELVGPGGFRLKLVKTGAETDGELLEMEASYAGGGLPPEHFHPSQVENFEVLEGAVKAVIDGAEHRYAAGESFEIPAGTLHQMAGDGPARVRWEIRPALRTAEFFERLYAALDPETGDPAAIGAILEEFGPEVQFTQN